MKNKEKIINIIKYFLSIFIPVFLINFLVIALAWDGPTQSPPGGTLPFPLTPSSTTQTKTGALGIGGIFEVTGTFLQLAGEKPVCNSTTRGVVWLEKGTAGTDSEVFFCKKDSADLYAWTTNNVRDQNYYWNVPVGAVLNSYDGSETLVDNASTATSYKLNAGMLVYETVGTYMLTIPDNVTSVEILVVAGGGGSGMGTTDITINGGGGGGGGLLYQASYTVIPGTPMSITVGNGGAGATAVGSKGTNGQNSVFGNLTATGGGGGGSSSSTPGSAGGSGGGGGRSGTTYGALGAGTSGQGYNGAAASSSVVSGAGGGVGGAASGIIRGPGLSFFGTVYAEGGAGGAAGGVAGTANTGRGGDARPTNSASAGFAGGSGVVIVSWFREPVDCSTMDIGDECGGGKVAYLDGIGGGLIAASADNSTGVQWRNYYTSVGASGTAIGTGASNTSTILSGSAERPIAASVCDSYESGRYTDWFLPSYTDWFLPSNDELMQLYINRVAIGGFSTAFYWSSSEYNSFYAQSPNFSDGFQYHSLKISTYRVRCVRAF